MNHTPVCVKCEVELRPEKNGFKVIDMFQHNTKAYKIWDADKWKCPKCGIEVVVGFGNKPLAIQHEGETFQKYLDIALGSDHCLNKEATNEG